MSSTTASSERAPATRRSTRDISTRLGSSYSIDTLFPGLTSSNNNSSSQVPQTTNGHGQQTLSLGVSMGLRSSNGDEVQGFQSDKNRKNAGNNGIQIQVVSGGKRKATVPLKPLCQPKQISLLSMSKMSKVHMFEVFQPWVLITYGDSAKTKTITKKKYHRIVKTLRGEEINNAENSKFRFWVKAKGFYAGGTAVPVPPGVVLDDILGDIEQPDLFVPTTVKEGAVEKSVYKRVAVVENFFDIIYTVHVETEAKNGKHAGQKRTYRAITEKYAFLPREAVTKFLLQCQDCQKRGCPSGEIRGSPPLEIPFSTPHTPAAEHNNNNNHHNNTNNNKKGTLRSKSPAHAQAHTQQHRGDVDKNVDKDKEKEKDKIKKRGKGNSQADLGYLNGTGGGGKNKHNNSHKVVVGVREQGTGTFDINFSLPFTTTYLRQQQQQHQQQQQQFQQQMRNGNGNGEIGLLHGQHDVNPPSTSTDDLDNDDDQELETEFHEDTHMSDLASLDDDDHGTSVHSGGSGGKRSKNGDKHSEHSSDPIPAPIEWLGYHPIAGIKKETNNNSHHVSANGKHDFREQSSPLSLSEKSSAGGGGTVTSPHQQGQDETSSNGNKDDEDDDDDESEDKIDTQQQDPERLKAFNMFVRLFVDENLDRMVPISKQPKEKIQAIIDSCTRQFPEFAERARKRIRTYLKSCRRNKRCRDGTNGWESSRPTPAHLTSVQAEQILAQACENESQNAKRMRMGLEPLGQPLPNSSANDKEKGNGTMDQNGHSSSSSAGSPEKPSKHSSKQFPSDSSSGNHQDGGENHHHSNNNHNNNKRNSPTNDNFGVESTRVTSIKSSGSSIASTIASIAAGTAGTSPLVDFSRGLNGNGSNGNGNGTVPSMSMYRPNFSTAFSRPAPFPGIFPPLSTTNANSFPANISPQLPQISNGLDNGPTDLSMKSKPLLAHKLNSTEMSTVRQLITGYRESAAFLLRSADELETLLIQQ